MKKWTRLYAEEVWNRFLDKVERKKNGCLMWTASLDNGGYPQIGGQVDGKNWCQKAHVLAWEHKHGPVPPGKRLAHTCNNRACVNVKHLRLASTQEQTKAALAAQKKPTRKLDRKRFMLFVEKMENGCWLWQGARSGAGSYGFFWLDKKLIGAHRASHILFKAPVPVGAVVMHSCDDRQCVNPKHLSVGSPRDNSLDMKNKGRSVRGDQSRKAKLDEVQVRQILAEYQPKYGELVRLANKFNVSVSTIQAIVSGQNWKHVSEGMTLQ